MTLTDRLGRASAPGAPSMRNTGPARTTLSTILTQDTVFTHGSISVRDNSPVALFANPFREGAEELFVIDRDDHLTYVHRTPAGDGWVQEEFGEGTPEPVSDVVTAVHPDGSLWLFVAYGRTEGGLNAFRLEPNGNWNGQQIGGPTYGWTHLSVHYLPDRPATPCVVGVDAGRTELRVLMPRFDDGSAATTSWETELDLTLGSPLPEVFRAGLQLDGTLRIYADDGQQITRRTYSGAWEPDVVIPGQAGASQLAGLWNAPEGLGCVFVNGQDGNPRAYTPTGEGTGLAWGVPAAQPLSQAATWQDERGMLHIFGISPLSPSVLQVIHQNGLATSTGLVRAVGPVFVSSPKADVELVVTFPLAGEVSGFHLDPAPDVYPSQLLLPKDPIAPCRVATQDVTTSWWSEEPITLSGPGGVVELQTRYVGDVTLLDGFGAPMPAWPVQLSSQSAVDVEVAGRMLRLGPTETAHVVTDGVGKLNLRVAAKGLTVPTIQLTAKGIAEGASVDLAAGVQGFLAGTSVLAAHPEVLSTQVLLDAKVSSGWLVPAWHDQDASGVELPGADIIVTACASLFALTRGTPPTDVAPPATGFVLQRTRGDQPAYRPLQAGERARDALGAGDDLTPYANDLRRGIREGVLDVVGFGIEGTGHAVFACEAPGGVPVSLSIALASDADASLAVEAIFQFLHAGVDRLVEWLAWPFPFEGVWQTAEAFSAALAELPQLITTTAEHYQTYLKSGWFVAHQQQVTDALAAARAQLTGVRVDSFPGAPSVQGALPAPIFQTDALLTPQSMWLHDLLLSRGDVQLADPAEAPDPDALWDPVWRLFTASGPGVAFQKQVDTARTAMLALWDLDDSSAVGGTPLGGILQIAEDLVPELLPLADVMVESLAALMTGIADDMVDILATPVTSADMLGMYAWFQRQAGVPAGEEKPLTIGGLGALYTAFPVTGAYTALLGTAPFPGGTFPALDPTPWGRTGSDRSVSREACLAMQVIGGLAQFFYTGIDVYVDLNDVSQDLNGLIGVYELLGFTVAGYPDFWDTPADADVADDIAWAQWALWTLLYATDFYLGTKPADHWLVTEYNGNKGSAFLMAIGVAQVALSGAAYGVSKKTDLDKKWLLAGVMGSLSTVTAPLRLLQNLPAADPLRRNGLAFKVMLDGIADGVAGLMYTTLALNELVNVVTITTTSLADAPVTESYTATLTVTGGTPPYTWNLEPALLPSGIYFDSDAGILSGTPAAGSKGTYDLVFSATDYYPPPTISPKVTLTLKVTA